MSERQIKKLLESTFWPATLEASKQYVRVHDDHDGTYEGQITVAFDAQGDVWLWTDRHSFPPMRFRTWAGGGMSLRVRNALIILAEAIRLDNEEKPQSRPPRKENER